MRKILFNLLLSLGILLLPAIGFGEDGPSDELQAFANGWQASLLRSFGFSVRGGISEAKAALRLQGDSERGWPLVVQEALAKAHKEQSPARKSRIDALIQEAEEKCDVRRRVIVTSDLIYRHTGDEDGCQRRGKARFFVFEQGTSRVAQSARCREVKRRLLTLLEKS